MKPPEHTMTDTEEQAWVRVLSGAYTICTNCKYEIPYGGPRWIIQVMLGSKQVRTMEWCAECWVK